MTDDGPGWEMAQLAQERQQQEAEDALQWWELRAIYQSYGTQQGIATAPDMENQHGIRESGTEEI
ncbi:hypothetical protein [Paraburkholderia atlantica]|uniref:hypothetical protein n=1 Tax=Paraburkholderia atlantica TaxID=2654982 RepID=UPI00161CD7BB|nr:hypothetical protein [Paraburkholderia atlantica]MBB5414051.1 hypothetical protein [Paraburkholderia atlantica]